MHREVLHALGHRAGEPVDRRSLAEDRLEVSAREGRCVERAASLAQRDGLIFWESGAVATEYALLLLLIALFIVASATLLGKAIADKFTSACNSLQGATC